MPQARQCRSRRTIANSTGLPLSIEIGASSPGTLGAIRIAGLKRHGVRAVHYLLPDPFDRKRSPSTAELQAWEARIKQFRIESYFDAYRSIKEEALLRLVTQLMSSGGK
jgi:hypothetical protein